MVDNFISGKLFRNLLRVELMICLVGALSPARVFATGFTARTIANSDGIEVMEVAGNYDALNGDESTSSLPRETIAQEFYKTHSDQYDFLVFFSNFDFKMPVDAVAFYDGVKNDVRGIGLDRFDNSSLFGSLGALQGTIDMGNLANLGADPLTPSFSFTMGTLSHELMHRWGAYVHFQPAAGQPSSDLLGADESHWSFLLDTKGSLEYGNNWHDNGDGKFTSFPGRKYFSPLDLYLMGVLDKSAVPPMLLIANPDVDPKQVSKSGETIGGRAGSVTIDQIIAAEGGRIPDFRAAQKSFRIGCVFLTRPGTYNPDSLPAIRTVLNSWPVWFSSLTNGLAQITVDAALEPKPATNPGPVTGTVDPRTIPPEITDGVTWLVAHQQPNGSWQENPSTIGRDTAESLRVLNNFPELFPDPDSGTDYLERSGGGNNDFLSRKIMALAALDHETTDLTKELLESQNQGGGWGGQIGQASNILDTALVLRTLAESGLTKASAVSEAAAYLNDRQNPDGGWGKEGQDSDILTTSNVIVAYGVSTSHGFELTAQLDKACTWLQIKQNMDGGFGEGSSSIYHTALAVSALQKAGITGNVVDKGLKFVRDYQAQDGSWNESSYETALAVEAIWTAEKMPDLQVASSGITIVPGTITTQPTQIEIVADIANKGLPNLAAVKVSLYEGEIAQNNLLGEQIISINGKSTSQVHFAVPLTNGNTHRFQVAADPDNLIAESSELNNRAMKWLYPETTYDLVVKPGDIVATPANVEYFQPVTITATVSNQGTLDAANVPVKFYLDDGVSPYAITTRYVNIPAGGATNLEFIWLADHPGANQILTVVADPFGGLAELDETNNIATTLLTVQQTTKANLKITHQEISINPSPALEAADAVISATVSNNGFSPVQNVVVEFRSAKADNSKKTLIGWEYIAELAAGTTLKIDHVWENIPITGDRIISVLVDPDNEVEEITEDDNQAFVELNILTLPDLAISASSIILSPAYPKAGEALTVQIAVQNNGGQAVKEVAVTLALDGGAPQVLIIPAIAGNAEGSATFTISPAEIVDGVHNLQVVLDPDDLILERTKTNNRTEKEFGVQNGDMWLTERYISPNGDGVKDSTQFFFRLKKKQTIRVAISDGDGLVVRKYEGQDLNDIYSGSIVWDGLSDKGTVVPDGEYRIGVVDLGGIPLGSLVVTVDTNRLSFLEAVGTEYLLQNNISCMLPDFEQGQWFKDESGLIISVRWPNSNTPDYPTGLYRVSPDGGDVTRLIPSQWVSGVGAEFNYDVTGYAISPDDETIAFVLEKYTANYPYSYVSSQLRTVDRYGENPSLLIDNDYSVAGKRVDLRDLQWSPDGKYLACRVSEYESSNNNWIWLINRTGGEANRIPANEVSVFSFTNNWSPDGSRFAYGDHQGDKLILKVVSASGTTVVDYQTDISGDVNIAWLGNDRLIATGIQDVGNQSWLFDVSGNATPLKFSDSQAGSLVVNQVTKQNFAFVDSDAEKTWWNMRFCDDEAQCQSLYQTNYGVSCDCVKITDLEWSPDGEKLAFISKDEVPSSEMPPQVIATLVVVESSHPTEQKTFPLPEISTLDQVSLRWADDNRSLLGIFGNSILVIDTLKGEVGTIPVSDQLVTYDLGLSVSPFAKYLTYKTYVSSESICADAGSQDLWAVSSLLNLTADLRAIKKKDYIELKGIASDRNFASYELEFAEVSQPNVWHTISPPAATTAINKVLGQWVPPGKGRYYVRLTATDKAGNILQNRIRLSWGLNTTVTGLYQSTDLFSPNGDQIKDTVEIHYRIMAPVNLVFTVFDKDNKYITSFQREYPEPPGVTGEDFITWDGRDSGDVVVPDGLYTVKVLDFDFLVKVDNTPPVVTLKINQTDCRDPLNADKHIACEEPFVSVSGEVNDLNIQGWVLESGEGDNPSEWREISSIATVALFKGEEVAQLDNKKFRLTAIDAAGNRSSVTSPLVAGMLFIQAWQEKSEDGTLLGDWRTGFKFLYADGQYDDSQGTDLITPPDSALGRSKIRAVETFGLPLLSGFVQEWQAGAWRDTEEFAIANDGVFVVSWNNTGAGMIRLRGIDEQGVVHYSNGLRISPPLVSALKINLGPFCLDRKLGDHGVVASLSNPSGIRELVYSYALEGQEDWQEYRVTPVGGRGYNRAQNNISPVPFEDAHVPELSLNGEYYTIRMEVYNEFGYLIRTLYCRYPEICGRAEIAVSYQLATACNSVAPGRATLALKIENPDFVTVQQGRYLLGERVAPEDYPPKPPKPFPPPVPPAAPPVLLGVTTSPLPVNTSVMTEGVYPVKSEVTFAYGKDPFVRESAGRLVVDRRIPEITLSAPAAGQKICPVPVNKEDGSTVNVISVNGNGTDYFSNAVSFGSSCVSAANPEDLLVAPFDSLKQTAQTYDGQLIVDKIKVPDLIFTLTGKDWVGNLGCAVNNFEIDTVVDFKDAHTNKEIFSSSSDEVGFDYTVNEDAKADLLIIIDPGHDDLNKLSIVRNLLRQEPAFAGQTSGAYWDGTDNAGAVAPDGKYAAYLILTDSCGNQRKGVIGKFILDNTPPEARIDFPKDGAQVGEAVELSGTAADANFAKYTLSLDPVVNNIFRNISPYPVKRGVLGTWQAFGVDGLFTITMEVSDRAGNTSTASVEVQRSLNDNLIKEFSVTPPLFSPNGDAKKESALIQYELNPEIALPLHTAINVTDENQQTVRSFNASYVATGVVKTVAWDGRDSLGKLVPDGRYVVALKAYYPASPEIFQIENLTVEVDATPPEITIKSPKTQSYLANNPLEIGGSVTDSHLVGYQVSLAGASETQIIDEGTEPRTDYKFASLHDLADGPYTLKVEATDLGEIAASKSIAFVVDRTPPKVQLNTPNNGAVYGGTERNLVEIDGSITELNLAHWQLKYSLKGSQLLPIILAEGDTLPTDTDAVVGTIPVAAVSGLADGTYVLSLSAIDKAGLQGEQIAKFDIDHTPPELAITAPLEGAYVTEPLDLIGTANDLHLQEYTLEIAEGDCDTAYEWSPISSGTKAVVADKLGHWQLMPPDGGYCLKLTGLDQVGYTSATSLNVKVDTHPPEPPLLSGQLQGGNAASLTWSGNSEPDLAGYNLYREGEKLNPDLLTSAEYRDAGLAEGSYGWQVTAVDLAGLESAMSAEVRLVVDLTPPESRIISPDNNTTVTDLVSIKGTAFSKDDFKEYRLFVGAGVVPAAWQLLRRSPLPTNYGELAKWDTTGLSEGAFSLKLEAEDLTGNINTNQITVTIDNQPPKAPVLTRAAARGALSADVDVVWDANAEADLAGYLLYRNDELANVSGLVTGNLKPYLLDAISYADLGLPDGTFEYYLLAMDKAGNLSDPSNAITVAIDTHPPHLQITNPADGVAFEHALLIRGETADLDIATVQFQFKSAAAGDDWTDLGITLTLPPYLTNLDPVANNLEYGDFVIRAVATDKHPNIDPSPQEVAVRYTDLTPPDAPQNLKSLTQGNVVTLTWDANTEADLGGYNVYRLNSGSETPVNPAPLADITFRHQGLTNGEYLYQVTAVDIYGNKSPASSQIVARVYQPLLTQPVTPVGVAELSLVGRSAQTGDQVELFKVIGVELVSAGIATADQEGNFAFNVVLSLGNNTFKARASDAVGNTSQLSAAVSVFFDEPPATPTGLKGEATGYDVKLTWNPNQEGDLAGYYVYRDGEVIITQRRVNTDTATVSASDQYNLAKNAIDGNPNTYWSTSWSNSRSWSVDFGADVHLIDKIELDWHSTYFPRGSLVVQAWVNNNWQQEYITYTNTQANNKITFESAVSTSKLNIYTYIPSYWSYLYLGEVRIFEEVPLLVQSPNFLDPNLPTGKHHYQVSAVDTLGMESPLCPEVMVPVGDVTPPSPPSNFTANASGSDAILDWDANTEDDLAGYNLSMEVAGEWRKLNAALLPAPGFTDPSLLNGVYTYRVTAVDKVGNESDPSFSAKVTINVALLPPPNNLIITPAPTGSALLACWQGESAAVAYNLYRGGIVGGPYDLLADSPLTATCYQDEGLVNGTPYYYVVTGLNRMQYESVYSVEASGTPALADVIPGPPPAPVILIPVAGGGEVTLSEPVTTVAGRAEPESMVGLYREGVLVGTTQVLGADAVESFATGNYPYGERLSPDGGKVFYGDFDYSQSRQRLAVYDYLTGANFESDAIGPLNFLDGDWWRSSWSPDGRRVAVALNDDNGQGMVWLSDSVRGQWLRLQPGATRVWLGDWSPYGQRLAVSYYNETGDWRTAVYDPDLDSYSAPEVPTGTECDYSSWAPDGRQIGLDCYDDTSGWLGIYDPVSEILTKVVPSEGECWAGAWSPDGRRLSLTCEGDTSNWIEVYDSATEMLSKITYPGSSETYGPAWSPDGQRLAFKFGDDLNGAKGAVYDPQNGTTSQLDLPDDLASVNYDWSPDSTGLLIRAQDYAWDSSYYLYTPSTGKISGLLDGTYEIYSYEWLPSGKTLILSAYSAVEDRYILYRYTVGSATPVELPVQGDSSGFSLSPDGSRLVYTDANRLNVLDLTTDTFATYDYPVDMLYWSSGGRQLAFTSWTTTGDDIWLLPLDAPEQARLIYQGSGSWSWVNELFLAADGRITMVTSGNLVRITPAGNFSFPDEPLPNRRNIFTATATDLAGNGGPASEAITVNLATVALPDLEVTANDIFIMPLSPTVGEAVQIEVAIHNRSQITARKFTAEVYLQQADGVLLFLASAAIPKLDGGQTTYLDLTWSSLGQAGVNKVFVILDPDQQLQEGNEENNQATREFLVAGAPGLTLTATLNRDRFPADDVLNLDLTIANSGLACLVRVEATIEDGSGSLVTTLPVLAKTLAYGEVDNELLAWAIGRTFAGDYRVRVVMKNGSGAVVAEKLLPFVILPDLKLRASLSSDALHYTPGQEVRLTARVDNLGANLNLVQVEARLVIASNSGELFSESRQITNLFSGGSAGFTEVWPVALNAPGNYSAALTVRYQGQEVAAASTGFAVDSLCNLTGQLQVEPRVVPLGSAVRVGCGLNSRGNVTAGSQALTVLLLDNLSQKVLGQSDLTADLTSSDSWTGSATFAAGLLPVGNFRVLFYRQAGTARVLLAEQLFTVADLGAPLLQVLEPVDGAILSVPPQLTVAVSDTSGGVGLVEYRLDQGSWRPMPLVDPATGRYSALLNVGESDEGSHLLAFRATDLTGNISTPVTVAITLQPLLELFATVTPTQPGLNQEMGGRLNLVNHGWAKGATLQAGIANDRGVEIQAFPNQVVRLLADATKQTNLSWNVGANPAGTYRLHGRLLRNGMVAAEGFADFAIQPTINLAGSIQPDQASYGINAPVRLAAGIASHGNFTIPLLTARLLLASPAGIPVYSSEQLVTDLMTDTSRDLSFPWNSGHLPAGHYSATLTLLVEGRETATTATAFDITAQPAVTGSFTPAGGNVQPGENLAVTLVVNNSGNLALSGLPVRLILTDAVGAALLSPAWTADLAIDASFSRTEELVLQGLVPGNYRLRLECDLAGETAILAEATFAVADVVPPNLTVLAPLPGATFTGPFALSVLATDAGSGLASVEYRVDSGSWLPLPAKTASGAYGLAWTPVAAESGAHLLLFRASDRAGNTASSAPVAITIALCQPFAVLTGTLAYQPQPLYQGQEIHFPYELINTCPGDPGLLTVQLLVTATDATIPLYSPTTSVDLGGQTSQAGAFLMAAPGLTAGDYTAILRVTATSQTERDLAVVDLAVQPGLEATAESVDRRHLLVWLNGACIDGEAGQENLVGKSGWSGPSGGEKPSCLHLDLLQQILVGTGDYFQLVRERSEFIEELRNPLVTEILILGDHLPLPSPAQEELREKVNAGAGLIASGWLPSGDLVSGAAAEKALLGVTGGESSGPTGHWRLKTLASPVTTAGELPGDFDSWRVVAAADSMVAGRLVDAAAGTGGWGHEDPDAGNPGAVGYPAIVLHDYGLGRTIYYDFDYGHDLAPTNLTQLSALLRDSWRHVHREQLAESDLAPLEVAPLRWEVTSPEVGQLFALQANLPPGLRLYDYQSGVWQQQGVWRSTLPVTVGKRGVFDFSLLAPEAAGGFTLDLSATVAPLAGGAASQLWDNRYTFTVPGDRGSLLTAARTALTALQVTKTEGAMVTTITTYLDNLRRRAIACAGDLALNIQDLTSAIAALSAINNPEVPDLRLDLDDLLRLEEGRWYFHREEACASDTPKIPPKPRGGWGGPR